MGDISIFSKRLKKIREKNGLTQTALATKINVTPQTISAYEKSIKKPTLENALAVAEEFGVSLDWMCGREGVSETSVMQKTLGDFARSLVSFDRNGAGVKILREKETIEYVEGFSLDDYHRVSEDVFYPVVGFSGDRMNTFLEGWEKMRRNYTENVVDSEVYEIWLDKQFSKLDEYPIEKPQTDIIEEDGDLPW